MAGPDFSDNFRLGLAIAQKQQATEAAKQLEGRKLLLDTVQGFGDLAKMPKEFRAVAVDSYNQIFTSLTGKPMAESLVKMLKSGNDEVLQNTFGALTKLMGTDPSITFDQVAPALAGDPKQLPALLKTINEQMVQNKTRETLGDIARDTADISTNTTQPASHADNVAADNRRDQFIVKLRRLESARNRALATGSDEGRKAAEVYSGLIDELNAQSNEIFKSPEHMMAYRLYSVSDPAMLSPAQANVVRQALDTEGINVKTREAVSVETAKTLDTPIAPKEARVYGLKPGVTERQLASADYKLPPLEQAQKLNVDLQNYRNTLQVADRLQKFIASTGGASLGEAGALTRIYNAVTGQVSAFAELLGLDPKTVSEITNPNNEAYANFWEETGIKSSQQRALMVSLAFMAGQANDQTGRAVSEPDVLRFMREVGGDARDPKTALHMIQQFKEGMVNKFKSSEKTLYGTVLEKGLREPADITATPMPELTGRSGPPVDGKLEDPKDRARLERLRKKFGGR